jgi:hypothetical protein
MEWMPISTAPRDATPFLAYRRGAFRECNVFVRSDGEMWSFGSNSFHADVWPESVPTHWMPLPEPPKEE